MTSRCKEVKRHVRKRNKLEESSYNEFFWISLSLRTFDCMIPLDDRELVYGFLQSSNLGLQTLQL